VAGGEGECGDDVAGWLVRERRSLDILPVKKEAKLSASEVPVEVVGSGEEDLRCRSSLTGCQRRLGLSEAEDMRLEKYSFLDVAVDVATDVAVCVLDTLVSPAKTTPPIKMPFGV